MFYRICTNVLECIFNVITMLVKDHSFYSKNGTYEN